MAAAKPTAQTPHLQPSPRRAGAAAAYVLWWLSDSIDFSGKCWAWTGGTRNGYGVIDLKNYDAPQSIVLVHRVIYSICVEPIPEGLSVLHRCDNPPCCRPDHLFLGTNQDNIEDKLAKGRQARGPAVRTNHDHLKGETVVTSRATAELVMEMRRADRDGESLTSIANRTGFSITQISSIVRGESWAHLPVLMTGDRKSRTCPRCGKTVPTSLGRYRKHLESCPAVDCVLGKG